MMKILILLFILASFGCKQQPDRKTQVLDSLKHKYADKEIHITLTNNQAGVKPLSDTYAYIDKNKSDLAFKVESFRSYKVSYDEGFTFIPTQQHPNEEFKEMVLIESNDDKRYSPSQRGYISYKYISEFSDLSYYDTE